MSLAACEASQNDRGTHSLVWFYGGTCEWCGDDHQAHIDPRKLRDYFAE